MLFDMMNEKRRERRLNECHEAMISDLSAENNFPEEKLFDNYCDDISASGARIHAGSFLPVDATLKMNIRFENMQQMMTTMAIVRWANVNAIDGTCEAGVEFYSPAEVTQIHMMPALYLYSEELKHIAM